MPEYDATLLLHTQLVTAWDCLCHGLCRGKAAEEWSPTTHISFPQRGVYVHSVGRRDVVADANQIVVINEDQPYRVSHPVPGGDVTLTVGIDRATLQEITPPQYRRTDGRPTLTISGLRIDARTQLMAAQLRQRLARRTVDPLEAETQVLQLVRRTLGETDSHTARQSVGHTEKMADDAKLLMSADPWRRWTLAEIADQIGVTPVYLTDAFRRVEGIPLYRYHLRMRLALALSLLAETIDLTTLAMDLGFASHSHFSASFKRNYGLTPSEFQKSALGTGQLIESGTDDPSAARLFLSRNLIPIAVMPASPTVTQMSLR
jgi:AraC family transcriptional regulator